MYETNLEKAIGLPEQLDPTHTYVYRSGEHGIYDYWWKDTAGNYWKYTNAPVDSVDYDPYGGNPLINPDQPMPHTTPSFFTEDGTKRNVAVPPDAQPEINEAYNPEIPQQIWYERYKSADGVTRFSYKDTDVKENLDLWVQQKLRLADASLVPYRQYAAKMFANPDPKDKAFAAIFMLADQAYYDPYELITATVGDVEFTDLTVNLLGRKFLADLAFVEYFSELKKNREPSSPLFQIATKSGENPITERHIYSMFSALKMPPDQLVYLHANQIYSRIVHRMLDEAIPVNDVEELANLELARVFSTTENVEHLVDYQVKSVLMRSYTDAQSEREEEAAAAAPVADAEDVDVTKSMTHAVGDDFGVSFVYSTLANKRPDELEFSTWLHAQPLHDVTPEEEDAIRDELERASNDGIVDENGNDVNEEGAVAGGEDEQNSNTSDETAVAGNEGKPAAPDPMNPGGGTDGF